MSASFLDPDFTVEVLQLALQVSADICDSLIVDGRTERRQHQVDDVICPKIAEALVKFGSESGRLEG